jgi:predicted dehydrogenase
MTDKIRVGVIGTSWWADMLHLPSLKSHPAAEIVAICGRNQAHAAEMARKYDIPNVFTDYQALLALDHLDAVIIAAPDDMHFSMTMAALDAGLHVLCEKPMALTADHARQMTARAAAAGVKHMVMFTWRGMPYFRHLKRLIDEGYLGRCYHAEFRYLAGYARQVKYGWRFDGQRSNGILGDLGAHAIDLAHWLVGDIGRVHAHLLTFVDRPGVSVPTNDSALLTVEFAQGGQAVIQASAMAYRAEDQMELAITLHGEAGTLELKHIFFGPQAGSTLRGARDGEDQIKPLPVPADQLAGLDMADMLDPFYKQSVGPRRFVEAILEDRPLSSNFFDGLKVQEVIEAALLSQQQGQWVAVR